jgi:hypothetical protein
MDMTRVNTEKLTAAVEKATKKIEEAEALLAPFLVMLTERERATMLRTRDGFPEAGRQLARAIVKHPKIAAASGFEADAVTEDIANVEAIAQLGERTSALAQRLADSRLTWLAEAWAPSLAAYAMAKVGAKTDGELAAVVEPLATIFATHRAHKAAAPQPAAPVK